MQVLQEHGKAFLSEMNSKAIAVTLRSLSIIPDDVATVIQDSNSREKANGLLLTFLKEDATVDQVQRIFGIAKNTEYGRMKTFAADILEKLQQSS